MTDTAAYDSTAPMLWGDVTSPAFKWSPGNPLPFEDLATLKADGTYGDGNYPGTMKEGDYVRLGDGSTAHYDGAVWKADPKPAAAAQQQAASTSFVPTVSNTKAEILGWLDDVYDAGIANNIIDESTPKPHDESMTKAELLAIVDWLVSSD